MDELLRRRLLHEFRVRFKLIWYLVKTKYSGLVLVAFGGFFLGFAVKFAQAGGWFWFFPCFFIGFYLIYLWWLR